MEITKTLYVTTRNEWRDWLAIHYNTWPDIWLITYRKHTGRPNLPYNSAVEEALCFGWIDSLRKGIDDERTAQRFSPRKPGSNYSQTNKERLARMTAAGKVIPAVMKSMGDLRPEDFTIPDDILSALQSNQAAWSFFLSTAPAYQRIRTAYIDAARKRPAEYTRRLNHLIARSAKGKQFGYDIEDYY